MHTPEGIRTEILLSNGNWENISSRVRGGSAIRISRGRKNEQGRTISTLGMTLDDLAGDFNDLNPLSPYYGLIGPNTQLRVSLGNSAALEDDFNRTVSNAWTGGSFTWTNSGGTVPDDYDINGTHGVHTHPSTNVLHYSTTDVGERNHRVRATFNLSAGTLTGANASVWLLGRFTDTSNYYAALVSLETSGFARVALYKRVAGVLSEVEAAVAIDNFVDFAATPITAELYIEGSKLYARAWTSDVEPDGWTVSGTDTSLTTGNGVGVTGRRETGNTNANLQVQFDSFLAVPGTIRAHVEVPNFGASRWTPGGFDVTMPLQGAGVKRRLGSPGVLALDSATTRYISRNAFSSSVVGYWPCEGGEFTGQVASGLDSGVPLNVVGTGAQFGVASPFPGTASMISMGASTSLNATIQGASDTGEAHGRMLITFPEAGLADDTTIMAIYQTKDSAIRKWYLTYQGSTGGSLRIVGYDQSFAIAENSGYIAFGLNGKTAQVQMRLTQDVADVDWEMAVDILGQDGRFVGTTSSNTFPSSSVGAITAFVVGTVGAMEGCLVGQISVSNDATSLPSAGVAATGHIDEAAAERFARLCDEEGIAYEIIGEAGANSSMRMGPQRIATLLQNLEDVEDAEHGIIYEARHFLGLTLRLHHTLVNQTGPNFTYTDGFLTGEPFPDPDDLLNANDVTATRYLGSKYRSVEESGSMSVSAIGRYVKPVNANVSNDSALPDVARWNRHVGTWRSARYPTVQFDTHRPQFTASISADVDELEIGDYFSVDDTPAWLEPGGISVLAQGYNEVIQNLTREIAFNCRPAGPYVVAVRGTSYYRDSLASTMNSTASAGATSLSVAVTGPRWRTGSVDFNIMVAGSVLHVTNISGASSPQTFTVDAARVNGIDKDLPAGSEVHIYPRPIRALTAVDMNLAAKADADDTFVTGVDTPPTVWAEGDTTGTFTSATFSMGADPVGVVFRMPHTGSFAVHVAGELDNDAAGFTILSWEMRSGPIIGEGTLIFASADTNGLLLFGTDQMRTSKMFMVDTTATGTIDPGKEYNIVLTHRRVTLGNAVIRRRLLLVRPLRTQGGLPGSLIDNEPQAEDDLQDTSDTSTSTSYTTADMTPCGTAFVAPASGKVLVSISARLDNSGANSTYVSFRVGTGTSVGAGTEVVAAADAQSLENFNTNQFMGGRSFLVTGLTAGSDYNVQLMHRVSAGTGTLENRQVSVEPVA